jgi:hypothetical protein
MYLFFIKHYIRNIVESTMPINSVDTTNPATCRTDTQGIEKLSAGITSCMRPEETDRNKTLMENTQYLESDIASLRAIVIDSLAVGDSMFGNYGHSDVSKQVQDRNADLKAKKDELMNDINKKEAIIERSNRDFTDVKKNLPEVQPKTVLHFIEDYTLAILSVSYLFMICVIVYGYTITGLPYSTRFVQAFITSIFFTMFMFMLLYYIT